jgi:hypothetical protein
MKRTSPFKSAGASVQSTTGKRAVHISLQDLYCSCKPVFCSHVMLTGYPLHFLVSPLLLLLCVTVCHHISTGLYASTAERAKETPLEQVRKCCGSQFIVSSRKRSGNDQSLVCPDQRCYSTFFFFFFFFFMGADPGLCSPDALRPQLGLLCTA